jgi:transcriptional regulator with XRE-family HTH domain
MSDIFRQRSARETETDSRRCPGMRLRWLRQKKGLTMGQLADVLGCSVTEVSAIERGLAVHPDTPWDASPDNDQAVAIPEALSEQRYADEDP